MQRFRFATLLAGWLILSLSLLAQQPAGPFRIAGTVVSTVTGSPLGRARVTIFDTKNREKTRWMITAEDGRFTFDQLPPGKYALQGAKRGFVQSFYEEHDEYSTAIVTGVGVDTENLVLRLPPDAELSGKVLDEAGEAVRDASVWLYREDHHGGVGRIVPARSVSTDDLGAYDLAPLEAGTYFLSAKAQPWYAVHPVSAGSEGTNPQPTSVDPSLDVAYANTYYADTTDPDEATPIPIRGGDHVQIELHLSPVPALHLIFHSPENANRLLIPNLSTSVFGNQQTVLTQGAFEVSPGVYELNGIPAGKYSVHLGASRADSSNEVLVTQNGEEIDVPTSEASPVTATVQVVGESSLPPRLTIYVRNSKMRIVAFKEVDEKGVVELPDLAPGKYELLAATSTKRFSVIGISSGENSSSGHFLTVGASSPQRITVTLSEGAMNVEGIVKHSGKPAARAMVVLVPKDPENNHDRFRRDQSDLDGSFSLADVIPGSYTVCAIDNGWDLDWAKPAVIAHYCRDGKRISVESRQGGTFHLSDSVELQSK